MKKSFTSAILALSIVLGAASIPVKKAEAGVIIAATAASVVTLPAAVAIIGMFGGFGTSVASIYWAIDHREKSWYAYGLFMLDENMDSNKIQTTLSQRYPELDSFMIEEISRLVLENSDSVEFNKDGIKEILVPEQDLAPILEILASTNPELGEQLRKDLTLKTL
jgi:hypothetical protein